MAGMRAGSGGVVIVLTTLGCLLYASSAHAVERFASSSGSNSGNCTATAGNPPCTAQRAINIVAVANDVVTLLSDGTYNVGTTQLFPTAKVTIRGQPGQPRPLIVSGAATAVDTNTFGSTVRDLVISHSGAGTAYFAQNGSLTERVSVLTTAGLNACALRGTATIRDSLCLAFETVGLNVNALAGGTTVGTVRNVTAAATGGFSTGLQATAGGGGASITIDAANTIAIAGGVDVRGQGIGITSTIDIQMGFSNFDSVADNAQGTITMPVVGSATNQTTPPAFVNVVGGNFRQAASSPTIDAGSASVGSLGSQDFDNTPRNQGLAPDIGADEVAPPQTTITAGPSGTIPTSSASFTFTSSKSGSFQCSVDGSAFAACSGPGATHALSGLAEGAHTFAVRALDDSGYVDPTPASRAFTVQFPPGGDPGPDTDRPDTEIDKGPRNRTHRRGARFRFSSDEAGASFECKLDRGKFFSCESPLRFQRLRRGRHVFRVRAIDASGNVDGSVAVLRWRVLSPRA